MVLLDDISAALLEFNTPMVRFCLLLGVLEFHGAEILDFESSNARKWWSHTEDIGAKFENLPDVQRTETVDKAERLERLFEATEGLLREQSDFCQFVACSRLHDSANGMRNLKITRKEKVRSFKKFAKELFKQDRNRNCMPLYWVFARELAELCVKSDSVEIARVSLVNSDVRVQFDEHCLRDSRTLALVNLLITFVKENLRNSSMLDSSNFCAKVIGNFVISGEFSEDSELQPAAMLIKAKKRLAEEILPAAMSYEFRESDLLTSGWLGSPLVLFTELSALYSYCCGNAIDGALTLFEESATVLRYEQTKDVNPYAEIIFLAAIC